MNTTQVILWLAKLAPHGALRNKTHQDIPWYLMWRWFLEDYNQPLQLHWSELHLVADKNTTR